LKIVLDNLCLIGFKSFSAPETRCRRNLLKRLTFEGKAFWREIYQRTEKRILLLPNYGEIKSFCRPNGRFSKAWRADELVHLLDEYQLRFTGCIPEQHGSNSNTNLTSTNFEKGRSHETSEILDCSFAAVPRVDVCGSIRTGQL
jgi:hypothetical protein